VSIRFLPGSRISRHFFNGLPGRKRNAAGALPASRVIANYPSQTTTPPHFYIDRSKTNLRKSAFGNPPNLLWSLPVVWDRRRGNRETYPSSPQRSCLIAAQPDKTS
jgi:hypothetical protein